MKKVIIIVFKSIFNPSSLINFTPWVISNNPAIKAFNIFPNEKIVVMIVVNIKNTVTIPKSKNIVFNESKILSLNALPNVGNSFFLVIELVLWLIFLGLNITPIIKLDKMWDMSIIKPNVWLLNKILPIKPNINNGFE